MSGKTLIPISALNIFDNKGLSLFYQVRECLAVYSMCSGVTDRRDVGLQIIDVLETFLGHKFTEQETAYLDNLLAALKKSHASPLESEPSEVSMKERLRRMLNPGDANLEPVPQRKQSRTKGVFETLKALSPDGVKLLNIKGDIDLNTLKRMYKKAARVLHPDVGGNVKDMQLLNQAYSLFHDAIINFRPAQQDRATSFYAINLAELRFSIHFTLASIYGDSFAADYAYSHTIAAGELLNTTDEKGVGQFLNSIEYVHRVLSNPARALGRIGMKPQLYEVAKVSARFVELYWKYWVPTDEFDTPPPNRDWLPSEHQFKSELGSKLVINHFAQAANAFRLGAIDEKRFASLQKKYKSRESIALSEIQKIAEFAEKHNFEVELSNTDYSQPEINPTVVTPLFFFARRFAHLDDDQKWEYLNLFKYRKISARIGNYLRIRANEILLGLIYKYDSIALSSLENEIDFFSSQSELAAREFQLLREFLNHLKSLTPAQRNRKLNILIDLDDPDYRPDFGASFTISLSDFFDDSPKDHKMVVEITDDYVEFAMSPQSELERYQSSGKYDNDFKHSWSADLEALRQFEVSAVGKFREKVWLRTKNPSTSKVIESHEPYVVGLLELGKSMHPKNTGQLQIGYSINKLTAAYAKEKNWDKTKYWIETFFSLPLQYRDRSSKGEQETLKKRLERANEQIRKQDGKPKLLNEPAKVRKSS